MTVYRYGAITGDEATGGLVDVGRAILLADVTTVAIEPRRIEATGVEVMPAAVALKLDGRVNRTTDERVEAVYLIDPDNAAHLAGELLHAIGRALGDDGFEVALGHAVNRALGRQED